MGCILLSPTSTRCPGPPSLPWPHIPPVPRGTHLGGRGVEGHVEDVGFLPGAAGAQDVIGVFHGVSQHHDLLGDTSWAGWGARTSPGHPQLWDHLQPQLAIVLSLTVLISTRLGPEV